MKLLKFIENYKSTIQDKALDKAIESYKLIFLLKCNRITTTHKCREFFLERKNSQKMK